MKEYKLEDYQIPGYNNLVMRKRHLLLYRPGLGKTVVATKAMYDVGSKCVLIISVENSFRVWEDHLKEWIQGLDEVNGKDTSYNIHRFRGKYNNTDKRRKVMSSFDAGADVNVYITTASAFIRDHSIMTQKFDTIIIDEYARLGLKNRKAKIFDAVKDFTKNAEYVWLLTGTPGILPQDFWATLHLLDPKFFSSYWKFVETFCYYQKDRWGGVEFLGIKNQEAWRITRDRYATLLTKDDVGHRPTRRQILTVEMTAEQEKHYKQLQEDMMTETENDIIIASTSLTKTLRWMQLMVCPKILDPSLGIGAAFEDLVGNLKSGEYDPHTVIFTPFVDAIPHFREYLYANKFPNVFVLHGGISADELQGRIDEWRKTKGIMICSILYATSFSLEPARHSFFVGRSFDPDDNEQAEERLNRLTTPYPVTAYYYAYENTYDVEHFFILDSKEIHKAETLKTKK